MGFQFFCFVFFHIFKRLFALNEVLVLSSFSFSPWRRIAVKLPWVPEVFLACGGNFRCVGRRPKPRAAKPGHYKDLTETGNRDRKVSGTQGTVKPKYWANLFKYIFFVLFFCLLLHRLARRISLPFYDFLQVIIVLILACVASVTVRFAPAPEQRRRN